MGFMDKLKEVGTKTLVGALTMAAKSYGTVLEGKHKMCKVSMSGEFDKIVFVKVAAIEAEYVIAEDIKTFTVVRDNNTKSEHWIRLEFNDGETSTISLAVNPDKGNSNRTAAERVAVEYREMNAIMQALAEHLPDLPAESRMFVEKIARFTAADPTIAFTLGGKK